MIYTTPATMNWAAHPAASTKRAPHGVRCDRSETRSRLVTCLIGALTINEARPCPSASCVKAQMRYATMAIAPMVMRSFVDAALLVALPEADDEVVITTAGAFHRTRHDGRSIAVGYQ